MKNISDAFYRIYQRINEMPPATLGRIIRFLALEESGKEYASKGRFANRSFDA
jgi:hypothetical protein